MAYTAWSVVFGEQPSASKWNQLGTNDAYFDALVGSGTAFTDYSASTTLTGWASTTTKIVHSFLLGKLAFVWFSISGTSNATTAKFTVPTAAGNFTSVNTEMASGLTQDNAVIQTSEARVYIDPSVSTTTVLVEKTGGSGAWTNSGTKTVRGLYIYEAA